MKTKIHIHETNDLLIFELRDELGKLKHSVSMNANHYYFDQLAQTITKLIEEGKEKDLI